MVPHGSTDILAGTNRDNASPDRGGFSEGYGCARRPPNYFVALRLVGGEIMGTHRTHKFLFDFQEPADTQGGLGIFLPGPENKKKTGSATTRLEPE